MNIFVSVGSGLSPEQKMFVAAIEDRIRAEGFTPATVGQNFFSIDAPLKTVGNLMAQCSGAVIIALVRYTFPMGTERPEADGKRDLHDVCLPTVWNQIEASMAYRSKLPMLVIADKRLREDGMLESGNDWFVQRVTIERESLNTASFNGIFADWRDRVKSFALPPALDAADTQSPSDLTVREIFSRLRPGELWKVLAAVATILAATFGLGAGVGHLGGADHPAATKKP